MLFEANLRKRPRWVFYAAGIGLFWLALLSGRALLAAGLLALAILAAHFSIRFKEPESADRLQKALLSSISHNLRTPLASIAGVLSTLAEEGEGLSPQTRRELIDTARQQASKLNRLVGNLLDMSRLEAGTILVRTELCDVQDVIGTALAQLGDISRSREISVTVSPDLPLVPMDFVLMTQVVQNLLDNALKYSSVGAPVEVAASPAGADWVEIVVTDRGIGIPTSEVDRVFDRFYRGAKASAREGGIGLGLSICKGFVEAHGGRIQVHRRRQGGTAVTVALPLSSGTGKPREAHKTLEENQHGYRTTGVDC